MFLVWGAGFALGFYEADFSWLLSVISEAKRNLAVWLNWFVAFLFTYGKEIIGLLGGTYGILKWWYYRESVLHERLKKYLEREDRRLKDARKDILYTIARPGERRNFKEPAFAVAPLRKVLKRRNFESRWSLKSPESAADRMLRSALAEINKRMETLEATRQAYREQAVTAHILKGALASVKAQRSSSHERDHRTSALQEFRSALAMPGIEHRIFVLEYLGHQYRCLGMLEEAAKRYAQLAEEVGQQLDGKERDLKLANAWRWSALIEQAKRWYEPNSGKGCHPARDLIGATQQLSGALLLRSHYEPFRDWDAIEQGDFEYIAAFVAHNLGYGNIRDDKIEAAETAYRNAMPIGKGAWSLRGRKRMLFKAANAGIERARKSKDGDFDLTWLLPPPALGQAKSPADNVGSTGGDQSVPETT